MGELSSVGGYSIIVPGYFVCAGILVFSAVAAAVVGIYRGRVPLYLAFAATCLISAFLSIATASYYLADSIAGAVAAQRWLATWGILLVVAIFSFVFLYTETHGQRGWIVAIGVYAAALLAANHLLPYGIRYSAVASSGWMHFSWGESLFVIEGVAGLWNILYRILAGAVLLWSMWRLSFQYRKGAHREALSLGIYLAVLFAASIQGALIDLGVIRTFYWVGFVLVGLALLMGANLVMRLREQNLALSATARDLRLENERRRQAEDEIRERAFRDALTGLPNRLFVQEQLATQREAAGAESFGAILECDLDHFKVINDALGHEVGDQLLREVSRRIVEAAAGEALVARIGGDAFLAVLGRPGETEDDAAGRIRRVAEGVALALARPVTLGDQALNVSASIGIAAYSQGSTSTLDVLARAELALDEAKRRGRNNIQAFLPDLQERADAKYRLVDGLRQAIGAGELSLNFQPQVDHRGRVSAAEALLRWNSPQLGAVSPAKFIPAAEESGLIHALGDWTLRQGCARLAAWQRENAPFTGPLSINVSPWQLARPDFVSRVMAEVVASGIDPRQLTVEITESALLYDLADAVAKLREIRTRGLRIALDDFGTGYSSLSLLKDLPLDEIKIDQSFVKNLSTGANLHLVRMVAAIGGELGLDVVAEGVESAIDRDLLLELGCRRFQGFLFCPALPESQFVDWLRNERQPLAHELA